MHVNFCKNAGSVGEVMNVGITKNISNTEQIILLRSSTCAFGNWDPLIQALGQSYWGIEDAIISKKRTLIVSKLVKLGLTSWYPLKPWRWAVIGYATGLNPSAQYQNK